MKVKRDGIKIVTIGGGSSYTPELMEGFMVSRCRRGKRKIRDCWTNGTKNVGCITV